MSRTSRRIAATLVLAAVAVSVPVAQGATRPNDRAVHGVGAIPDAFERAAIRAGATGAPDAFERAVLRAEGSPGLRPDDRGDARGPGSIVSTPLAAPAGESGFSREYLLVGAVGTMGLCLAALAGLGLAWQHRRLAPR